MSFSRAILSLRPGAEFTLTNSDDYSTIIWHSEGTAPTEAEVLAEDARLKQEDADKKAAAEAKLAAIGLTPEDLKAIFS